MSRKRLLAPLMILAGLAGCARRGATAADVSSELRRIGSSAAEAGLFIERIRTNHVSATFARIHAGYLVRDARDAGEKLQESVPAYGMEEALNACRQQQEFLDGELSRLLSSTGDAQALGSIHQSMSRIQRDSAQLRSRL
jgi:hypothetical protein